MERRCAGVFVTLILLFMAMVLRIFVLSRSAYYAAVAGGQSSWLLEVDQSRGQIYDCNLKPLTGSETRYVAAVEPSAEAAVCRCGMPPIPWDRRFPAQRPRW